MCLGVPAKVIKTEGEWAWVDVNRVHLKINTALAEGVKPGDYVIVHAGFAIQRLSQEEGETTLELFKQIVESDQA
jgi:hydrogenase expression/formation protein HypC